MATLSTYTTQITIGGSVIGGVTNVAGPNESLTMIDSTDLSLDTMTKIAGLIDSGEVTLTIDWDPDDTEHIALRTALEGRTTAAFVQSFVLILASDLFLNILLDAVYHSFWPEGTSIV